MTKEEILAEAKIRYPVGQNFITKEMQFELYQQKIAKAINK